MDNYKEGSEKGERLREETQLHVTDSELLCPVAMLDWVSKAQKNQH